MYYKCTLIFVWKIVRAGEEIFYARIYGPNIGYFSGIQDVFRCRKYSMSKKHFMSNIKTIMNQLKGFSDIYSFLYFHFFALDFIKPLQRVIQLRIIFSTPS